MAYINLGSRLAISLLIVGTAVASAQEIWFMPAANTTVDFTSLFAPSAPWANAARKIKVFKVPDYRIGESAMRQWVEEVNRRGIAIAWEPQGLTYDGTCGQGVDGFVEPLHGDPAGNTLFGAQFLRSLGANVQYIAFNEPYQNGSLYEGPNACRWSADKVASQVMAHVRAVRSVFPNVKVGDMEGVPGLNSRYGKMAEVYTPWLDAYKRVSGEEFDFIQADVGWVLPSTFLDLEDMRRLLGSRGIKFGIMYDGHNYYKPRKDIEWTTTAERHFVEYETLYGPPDQGVIQSWDPLPTRVLPETSPGTMTYLVNRYGRDRTRVTATRRGNVLQGMLLKTSGAPVATATLGISAKGTSGNGIAGDLVITGFVPAGATQGTAGIRINTDCESTCGGSADITVYRAVYSDSSGYSFTGDFSAGMQGWSATGSAWSGAPIFETDSFGRGLRLTVSASQSLSLNAPFFRATPETTFTLRLTARIPPSATRSGFFSAFLLAGNQQTMRYNRYLAPGLRLLGTATTAGSGAFQFNVPATLEPNAGLTVTYDGSDQDWPAQTEAIQGLRFVSMTPCRIMETRAAYNFDGRTGAFGPPNLNGGETRGLNMRSSRVCSIPATAKAYVVNVTVIPNGGGVSFATLWPAGEPRPNVWTVRSPDGQIVANSAILQAGINGDINLYTSDRSDYLIDISGYYTDSADVAPLVYYPLTPCRVIDTRALYRSPTGPFGPPSMAKGETRKFRFPATPYCTVPPAAAYSVTLTAVPPGQLPFLTAWQDGVPQPGVSTINSFAGRVIANSVVIPASADGSINIYSFDTTDFLVDINGYYAPDNGTTGLYYYPITQCRASDTSISGGPYAADTARTVSIPAASGCSHVPSDSKAYAITVTALPNGNALPFITAYPSGQPRPNASILNAFQGQTVSASAIIPAGANGGIEVYAFTRTDVVVDVSGYFAR